MLIFVCVSYAVTIATFITRKSATTAIQYDRRKGSLWLMKLFFI
jgi:hypothetical protein